MVRRLVLVSLLVAVVCGLAFVGGPVGAVVPWALIAYVTWRAWPGIAADFGKVRPMRRVGAGAFRRRGGERL